MAARRSKFLRPSRRRPPARGPETCPRPLGRGSYGPDV